MSEMKRYAEWLGRFVYALISLSLAGISIAMMGAALWDIWGSLHDKSLFVKSLLDAIGLIVIGMAVFDVSKFLLEEEVIRSSSTRSPAKQRATLLKFLVIIAIAVSLEALVFIFDAGKKDVADLVYPTLLLVSAVLVVVGLGVYQRLTRDERE